MIRFSAGNHKVQRFVLTSATVLCCFLAVSTCGCKDASDSDAATRRGDDAGQTSLPGFFSDVTSACGIDFIHQVGEVKSYFLPYSTGSGAGVFDYDGDGRLDIYFIQNSGPDSPHTNRLYHQEIDGRFTDVTDGSGLDVVGYGMGVAAGDMNNDGRVDILLNEYGRVRLMENRGAEGESRFVDVTEKVGLNNPFWGTSTCFVDYDRDGWLDVVLVNYVNYDPSRWCADSRSRQEFCGPDAFPGRITKLFHNLGASDESNDEPGTVRFEDVTMSSGLAARPGPGLGVFCADFDGDRWPDLFISIDGKPNHLWINQKDGTFKEDAAMRGIAYNSMGKSEADMGVAIGDVNGDGLFDVFVCHLASETHTLWQQQSPGIFQDRTATSGVTAAAWRGTGFGTVMGDFDNDGWIDLAVANGRITRSTGYRPKTPPELDEFWIPYAIRNQLHFNDGNGAFLDMSEVNADFCGLASVSRGLVCGDIDNDGGLDLLVVNIAGSARLYRNAHPTRGNWLLVRAFDPELNRDAYGAEVYVRAGNRTWMRWTNPGYSFLCSNDPRAHFGLGTVNRIDSMSVVWPSGDEESFPGGDVNRLVELRRGTGAPAVE